MGACSMLAAQDPKAPDYKAYEKFRELQTNTEQVRPSADLKWISVEQGILSAKDWSLNAEPAMLIDFLFSGHPEYAIGLTRSNGLWIYSTKTFKAASSAGIAGSYLAGDVSPDGKWVLARWGAEHGLVLAWDWASGEWRRDANIRKCGVVTLAGFVDAKTFVTMNKAGTVSVWSVEAPGPVTERTIEKPGEAVAVFAPDRKALYVLAEDGVHRITTNDLSDAVATPKGYNVATARIEVGPKRLIAVYSPESPVDIFEADTLKFSTRFAGHEGAPAVGCAAFTPDEKHIVVGDAAAKRVHVYRLADTEPVMETTLVYAPTRIVASASWIFVNAPPKAYVLAPPLKKK